MEFAPILNSGKIVILLHRHSGTARSHWREKLS